jgi:hypothetical protein
LHFKIFIERSLKLINSPFFNFTRVFFELILSKIFISVKEPSVASFANDRFIKKNKLNKL